jgi:hypothetical protein
LAWLRASVNGKNFKPNADRLLHWTWGLKLQEFTEIKNKPLTLSSSAHIINSFIIGYPPIHICGKFTAKLKLADLSAVFGQGAGPTIGT